MKQVPNEFSRYAWVYFISDKSEDVEAFEKFLADLRVEGVPSEIAVVRSDDGGEFMKESS